jgi:hypothetical protein
VCEGTERNDEPGTLDLGQRIGDAHVEAGGEHRPQLGLHGGKLRRAESCQLASVETYAVVNVALPEPPPASTRMRASYSLPSVMPMPCHALKCSEIEM